MAGTRFRQQLWAALGWLNLTLGVIGIVTPLLPTTVFILMAAACFSRSHPQLEARLLAHPRFGPAIRDWRTFRGMRRQNKRTALLTMALSFGLSISLLSHMVLLQAALLLLWMGLSAWILHLPVIDDNRKPAALPQCTLRAGTSQETQDGYR